MARGQQRSSYFYTVIFLLSVFSTPFLLSACSSSDKHSEDAEASYNIAQEYDKDERYEEAIRRYQEIKNKFPYSRFAALSELAIADDYYKQESYPEAQVAYQNFKDMHPKHAKIDYVIFKTAMSYYNQLPPTFDRDLAMAGNAIQNFDDLIQHYPNSEHLKEAQEKRKDTVKQLAQKENYIADFYFKKEQWSAAMVRYENGIRKFPGQEFDDHMIARAAICAAKLADMDKARTLLRELKSRFPDSHEINSAEREIK